MTFRYKYFNRDISWLAFNYRVLEEAKNSSLPLYERMRFLAFYSSNLDEFYKVRVAEYRNMAETNGQMEEVSNPAATLQKINFIVSNQMQEFTEIFNNEICPALLDNNIMLYNGKFPDLSEHKAFMHDYFYREVIPYLQPVLIGQGTRMFLRDNRPYFAIKLLSKNPRKTSAKTHKPIYALVKLPTNDLPRFIELPQTGQMRHLVFIDDIIRNDLGELFPGYEIEGAWSIKISRDADLGIDDDFNGDIVKKIRENLVKRKTGLPSSFYHDRNIAPDLLGKLRQIFGFADGELVASDRYLNMHNLLEFPTSLMPGQISDSQKPIHPIELQNNTLFGIIKHHEILLHYPYHSFDYVIKLLNEAAVDPKVEEIKVTQYRVATNSAVVNSLIAAASNKKKVTVFVELKARFDEENNLQMAERMKAAGIQVFYSIPGLKVHAKMALIVRKSGSSYAYLSTGNFNEKTARQYTDHGLFTSDETIINDLTQVFDFLEDQTKIPELQKLLLMQVNIYDEIIRKIDHEIGAATRGEEAHIIMKMNGIQNRKIINKLYEASLAGVKIDLIIRGICCIVPNQSFSRNIRITRIVDCYLEHGRVWIFGPNGANGVYLTSSDWLNRNVNRRIEVAFPIENESIKQEILDIISIQLSDNQTARLIDENLNDNLIPIPENGKKIRSQKEIYDMLLHKNMNKLIS